MLKQLIQTTNKNIIIMKKVCFLFITVSLLFLITSCGKNNMKGTETPSIEVTGSAELEVEPDEVRLSVTIANYSDRINTNFTDGKVSIEAAEKRLMDILTKAGIDKKQIVLADATTNNYWSYYIRYGRYMDNIRLEKKYEITLTDVKILNDLLSQIPGPKEGFVNVGISELKNTNMEEYRKKVKIMAMQAAKEKAGYLLESVGGSVGDPLYVLEMDEDTPVYNNNTMMLSNMRMKQEASFDEAESNTQMKSIKLRYRIKAKFAIK